MTINRTPFVTALAWIVCGVAAACAAAVLVAGPGYRMSWWSLGPGLQTIRWAATVAVGTAAVGLITVMIALGNGTYRPLRIALLGFVTALVVALQPISLYLRAQAVPRIHDITTDTENPPTFVAVMPLRKGAPNSTHYKAETAAEQKKGYPDVAPLILHMAPAQAFERAERAARAMNWDIVAVSPADLRIEATDTTLLFGFKDDVVIRIAPNADGSRVDVRSLSRVGSSDLGVNAKRVRSFLANLAAE